MVEQMDVAAAAALQELDKLVIEQGENILPLADWFRKWYLQAGYKRLGRLIRDNVVKQA